mmetsp:Transcript_20252/g.56284  ORF Transcript_20252/g.56284 Transcript_20252/m.56284 type:complete len:256 (-) Transcript_20252:1185-1952(-)
MHRMEFVQQSRNLRGWLAGNLREGNPRLPEREAHEGHSGVRQRGERVPRGVPAGCQGAGGGRVEGHHGGQQLPGPGADFPGAFQRRFDEAAGSLCLSDGRGCPHQFLQRRTERGQPVLRLYAGLDPVPARPKSNAGTSEPAAFGRRYGLSRKLAGRRVETHKQPRRSNSGGAIDGGPIDSLRRVYLCVFRTRVECGRLGTAGMGAPDRRRESGGAGRGGSPGIRDPAHRSGTTGVRARIRDGSRQATGGRSQGRC